jgi:hypothetical protein
MFKTIYRKKKAFFSRNVMNKNINNRKETSIIDPATFKLPTISFLTNNDFMAKKRKVRTANIDTFFKPGITSKYLMPFILDHR